MEFFLLGYFPLLLLLPSSLVSSLNSDGLSLLALKAAISTDPNRFLHTWSEDDRDPCQWDGITCTHGRVTEIYLPNKGFNGYIPSELGALVSLRILSLSHNNFTKPIPSRLFNATSIVSLDLSHNSLTGHIPDQIKSLKHLIHLDLSSNLLNGSLPDCLSDLHELSGTLNLSYNYFSGEVPASYGGFPVAVNLDLRHNNLSGKIPQVGSLLNQGPTSFIGNPSLCGFPLRTACPEAGNPTLTINPTNPRNINPDFSNGGFPRQPSSKPRGSSMVVPIISGVSFIVGAVSVSMWVFRKKCRSVEGKLGKEISDMEGEDDGQKGKFVVVEEEGFGLELEDLLRASAYVAGKSRSGIMYKVVVGRGSGGSAAAVVAVRRLSEAGGVLRLKDFETEVEAICRVRHPNIVRLRAYYYAFDEKLLISDFIPNGSLYSALHGGPSNLLPPLSWTARLKIAQGAARGLMCIHECSTRKYVHGSIKSSKILLDNDLQPYISGFGLNRLVSGSYKSTEIASKKQGSTQITVTSGLGLKSSVGNSAGYIAPEARVPGFKLTQKCDVYSFGIVLLEVLTGQLPDTGPENYGKGLESYVRKVFRDKRPLSEVVDQALLQEVQAKRQVLAAFHVALSCTEFNQDLRPRMRVVSESLDRIGCH
ncbi:receptor protein kinase-like protein ZAR1 [Macadamia integrifolia]|uniref:receptor protein kinase-like protein ZAR1 n=1 Tax=Macadamia integrifolia TaxID=60698 RepID=UPI001C52736D|nr:receptor protein kinase-like protein ZAR1 [Macadamia integrifolia]